MRSPGWGVMLWLSSTSPTVRVTFGLIIVICEVPHLNRVIKIMCKSVSSVICADVVVLPAELGELMVVRSWACMKKVLYGFGLV